MEEILETSAGLREVEEVTEGLRLAEVQLGLIRPDVVVHLERDEEVEHGGFATFVQWRARASAIARGRRGVREGVGGVWWSDERGVGREVGRAQHVHTGYTE